MAYNNTPLFSEITFDNIQSQIESWLKVEHNKANILYSEASPYGQILSVVENLHQLSLLYLKNSVKQFDLSQPNSLNELIIRNAAIFAGHIPGRSISATGNLKLTLKAGINLQTALSGGRITFTNYLQMKNKTNSLNYCILTGQDSITYMVNSNTTIYLSIIQGSQQTTIFTGTGESNQSYQVALVGNQDVENFNVNVSVNGQYWTIEKTLYDLETNDTSCVVRTGFNGGIDIIFGNGSFGMIPPLASVINVEYIVTDGASGNIFRRTLNDWVFVDQATDGSGNSIDPSTIFDIQIYNDINFGANEESTIFTKNILPIVSNNFVLGLPQQYVYAIKRLGVFSHVNAYQDSGMLYIVCTPNINLFKNQNSDYFSIDVAAFTLDAYEISKIDTYLRSNGNILLSRKYQINSPVLSYYIMNVFVIRYSDATDDSVSSQIIDTVGQYFFSFSRLDRVPKSDIVQALSLINDIYSIDIQFICKNNEDYQRTQITTQENKRTTNTQFNVNVAVNANKDVAIPNSGIIPTVVSPNYMPDSTIGLDPVLGDIIFDSDEIPIIRGGWYDRNGIFYSDNINDPGLTSINIINEGTEDSKNRSNY